MPSPSSSSPAPDALDRLFRRIVGNLAELDPSRVHGPVEIAELVQRLVPYRTHRTSLALDSHDEYQLAVLRLLSGERGYAFVEPEEARAALLAELTAINPDLGLYEQYPAATITFDAEQVRGVLAGEEGAAAPPAGPAGAAGAAADEWFPSAEPAAREPEEAAAEPAGAEGFEELPFALEDEAAEAPAVAPHTGTAPCAFCGGALPVGRAVIYCPHCGQNVGVVHCPSCGTELDVGWRFCVTCGRKMGELA